MSSSPQVAAGKEIVTLCNKCKLNLSHIIVTMKSDTLVGKVQCKTCKGTHAFKNPTTKHKLRNTNTSSTEVREKMTGSELLLLWEKATKPGKSQHEVYSAMKCFSANDVIDHKVFGLGLVEKPLGNDKVVVIFKEERKTLVHNRAKPTEK